MQCKCGADTRTDKAVQSKLKAELTFYVCTNKRCGRVSSAQLWIDDRKVAEDPKARGLFQALNAELASELLTAATPSEPSRSSTPTTGELF